MNETEWEVTTKRCVAFFDILGFKDFVSRNTHLEVLNKLEKFNMDIKKTFDGLPKTYKIAEYGINDNQTKSVVFSDSILLFSKSDTFNDILKIILDSYFIIKIALENNISIKGALSCGEVTVDFSKSLYFGQPIIDAYLLHEELTMLTAIFDNHFENKLKDISHNSLIHEMITEYKANMKFGKVTHKVIRPFKRNIDKRLTIVTKLYETTSGKPRVYIDNTIEFLNSIKNE